jgi:ABC-type transport system involved in multi-copper enzyme maturation permease subunit
VNLVYKAWLESRALFVTALLAAATFCVMVLTKARIEFPVPEYPTLSYSGFVWGQLYGSAVPGVFSVVAVLLGLGGLERERARNLASFTLALPVGRWQHLVARTAVGMTEVMALACVPVALIPLLSPALAHHSYPVASLAAFALLFISWGAIWLSVGVLWSTCLPSDRTTLLVALLTPFAYMLVYARVSDGGRRFFAANPFTFMSGVRHIQPNTGLVVEPLPWLVMVGLILVSVALVSLAIVVASRRSF